MGHLTKSHFFKHGLMIAALALTASCRNSDVSRSDVQGNTSAPATVISTQNANDNRVAKDVFGHIPVASDQRSESFGGCTWVSGWGGTTARNRGNMASDASVTQPQLGPTCTG